MKLYAYQEEGVEFLLAHRRRYEADGMGLGKTIQACVAAKRVGAKRVLTVAPASAIPNWYREWEKWGDPRALFVAKSYNHVARYPHLYNGADWDVVIPDEAHYAKSRDAQRTTAVLRIAKQAPRAWLLSGTPAPNHPGELWCPIRALWSGIPRRLGIDSYYEWLDRFCNWSMGDYGPKIWSGKNGAQLRPYLNRIMLRRQLDDIELQLPPMRVDVSLLPRDKSFDVAMREAGIDPKLVEQEMLLATSDQKTSTVRRLLGTYKAPRIAKLVDEELRTQQYPKIVLLAHHKDTIALMRAMLDHHGVVGFTGDTPPRRRQAEIDTFTNDPEARVFLGQQTAAGIAINLQVSTEIGLVEPSWSPDDNAQAIFRIRRIGSTKPCRARIWAVQDTMDEGTMRVLARKTAAKAEVGL